MKKRKTKIQFNLDETDDITEELIEVKDAYYTKRTSKVCGSLRFPIPTEIVQNLNLKASDNVYYVKYEQGIYLSFKYKPDTSEKNIKTRKLAEAGNNILFLAIPPYIKSLYKKDIKNVILVHTPRI